MPELNEFENLTALVKSIRRDRAAVSSSGNTGGDWALRKSTERCFLRLDTQVSPVQEDWRTTPEHCVKRKNYMIILPNTSKATQFPETSAMRDTQG